MERAFEISTLSGVFRSQSDFAILDSQVVDTVGQDGEEGSHWENQEVTLNDYWGKVSSWYQRQPLEASSLSK